MITLNALTEILGNSFFDGNSTIAGIVIYVVVIALIFGFCHNAFQTLIISMPVTFIFSLLGILNDDLMILLIIVSVMGLAFASKDSWSKKR